MKWTVRAVGVEIGDDEYLEVPALPVDCRLPSCP
jgi:hypothetical protein